MKRAVIGPKPRASRWRGLVTEAAHPGSAELDRLGVPRVVALMQSEDRRVLSALRTARPQIVRAAMALRDFLLAAETVFCSCRDSGRLAVIEAAELPPKVRPGTAAVPAFSPRAGGGFPLREGAEDAHRRGRPRVARPGRENLVIAFRSAVTPVVHGLWPAPERAAPHRASLRQPFARSARARLHRRALIGPAVVADRTL